MSTFLAALPKATLVLRNSVIWEFSESGGGFGYISQKIEIIILLQAAAASTTQELLVCYVKGTRKFNVNRWLELLLSRISKSMCCTLTRPCSSRSVS